MSCETDDMVSLPRQAMADLMHALGELIALIERQVVAVEVPSTAVIRRLQRAIEPIAEHLGVSR